MRPNYSLFKLHNWYSKNPRGSAIFTKYGYIDTYSDIKFVAKLFISNIKTFLIRITPVLLFNKKKLDIVFEVALETPAIFGRCCNNVNHLTDYNRRNYRPYPHNSKEFVSLNRAEKYYHKLKPYNDLRKSLYCQMFINGKWMIQACLKTQQ